jgi:hypothetical protein
VWGWSDFRVNVIFLCLAILCLVIPNSVSEARVFFSARVGVRDLLFLFETSSIYAIDIILRSSREITVTGGRSSLPAHSEVP